MSSNLKHKIKSIAAQNGIILLYHSIAETIPDGLQNTLHNVHPEVLQKHLEQVSAFFQFVSLEEFASVDEKKGLAAITFDDGYKNVLENALPILESFNCPLTFFLNPLTFKKRWNWRDKVRYLINHDLVNEFERDYQFSHKQGRFYRYSKNPVNNSAELDLALDRFLVDVEIDIYPEYPYLQNSKLPEHPLIVYGNHSLNHYVLSSLSSEQQKNEIVVAKNLLELSPKHKISSSFSAPFGGDNDINNETISILNSLGYKDLLMSRQQLQPAFAQSINIQILERFMPRSDDIIGEIVVTLER